MPVRARRDPTAAAVRDDYASLAAVYDAMAGLPGIREFYPEWRQALLEASRRRGARLRVLVARRKSARVRWYRQDMTQLRLDLRADAVTCHGDALNHVLDRRHLERVFRNVAAILGEGGLFIFDLSTPHMLRWLHGRDKLFTAGGHVCVASNDLDERTGIATFRHIWFVKSGRHYLRHDVIVRQRAYPDAELRAMLRAARLRLERITVQRSVEGRAARKIYVAVKA
jgi:SAM-dependent methyltransferase